MYVLKISFFYLRLVKMVVIVSLALAVYLRWIIKTFLIRRFIMECSEKKLFVTIPPNTLY